MGKPTKRARDNLTLLKLCTHLLPKAEPMRVHLTIEANQAGPIFAEMLAHLLMKAGAEVTLPNNLKPSINVPSLKNLRICIGRTVWVRDEETERWP